MNSRQHRPAPTSMDSIKLLQDCHKQWELLLLLLSNEEKNIDRTSENEIDTVNYFYENDAVRKILKQWLWQMRSTALAPKSQWDTATKCDEVALLWRDMGNECFRANDMRNSYKYYTKSVLYAKRDSETFALAVGNRSAVLRRIHRFKECLMDIKLALSSGFPQELSHKLHLREAECYLHLNQIDHAKVALALAVLNAQNATLSCTSKNDLDRNIDLLEKKILLAGESQASVTPYIAPKCFMGDNPNFVNASAAVQLRKSDTNGRHVVATTDVTTGAILFVEDPYAFVALPIDSLLPLVCENCCESNINSVPCLNCSRSIYCSDDCRALAWDTFHQWECIGSQSEVWPTIGIAHLALRVLLNSTKRGLPATNLDLSKPLSALQVFEAYSKLDNIEIYKSSDQAAFYRVFHLVTNFDKMNNMDYIQYALTAVMLTLYLEEHTKYFQYLPTKLPFKMSQSELRTFAASLLLRNMGQLVCNGHAIMALDDGLEAGERTAPERVIRHATAIYTSASMMNHSCDPNIAVSFQSGRLVVKAARNVSAGEQVYNCYGPVYTREKALDRRVQLSSQYHFICACPACSDPDKKDFILLFTAYSCHLCKGPVIVTDKKTYCKQCKSSDLKLNKTLATLNQSEDLIKQSELCANQQERCEKLLASLRLKQQVLHRHHIAVRETMNRLACNYAELGEWSKSVEMIKQCIPSLEYQFGSFSVEVAHELRKLADVMLERVISHQDHPDFREWCLETHKIIKKAMQLLELNYGTWDVSYQRLQEKEQQVLDYLAQSRHSRSDHSIHDLLHYNLKI